MAHVYPRPVPLERTIINCRDDEPCHSPSRKALRVQIKKWRREGATVLETSSNIRSPSNKSDLNDLLQAERSAAVAKIIKRILAQSENSPEMLPLQWARKATEGANDQARRFVWRQVVGYCSSR